MKMLILRQITKLQTAIKYFDSIRLMNVGVIRCYSVYPPTYKQPVFSKKKQAILRETGEAESLIHSPIRPALGHETSSEFYDPLVHKFTNYLMRKGKKQLARTIVEHALEKVKRIQLQCYHKATAEERDKIILDPVNVLHKAVENVTPIMQLLTMKKGGSNYQVPVPILENRQRFLAMNWLITAARDKKGNVNYYDILAKELIDAANNRGRVVKKKQDLHKQCEANRAYAHYRWS